MRIAILRPPRTASVPRALALALLPLAAAPVFAHHTFAMFDGAKKLTLQGTVKELQWTNPHCFIQLLVSNRGAVEEWSLQMDAPLDLYRNGWRPHTLNAGDEITVIIHPSRDGRHSGDFLSGSRKDGRTLPST